MTPERTKAILAMMLTFFIGIVIGIFIPGVIRRVQFSEWNERLHEHAIPRALPPSGDRFERAIYRIINPDSIQEEKMKSSALIHNTTTRIASIHRKANNDIKLAMDSLITNLTNFKGLLRDDQKKRLEEFEKNRMVEVPIEGHRGFGPGGPRGRRGGPGGGPGEPAEEREIEH